MPGERGRRAAQAREKRRAELLEAATGVFAKRGYRSASISDIIKAAGAARGTFYLYFRSKQDILLAIIDELREQQKALITVLTEQERSATPLNPREQARQGFLAWLRFYDARRDALKILLCESHLIDPTLESKRSEIRQAVVQLLAGRVRRLQSEGVYQRHLSPEIVSHFLIGMLDEIALTYLQKETRPDLEKLAEQCVSFELEGLLERPQARKKK